MINSLDELHVPVHGLITQATGLGDSNVILADQSRPAPRNTYVAYKVIPVRAYGHPGRTREDTIPPEPNDPSLDPWLDILETVITQLEIMVSVNCYNDGAANAAWKLHDCYKRQPIANYLFSNDIGFRGPSEIRNLTGLQQAAYQERYQLDLNLFVEAAISDKILKAAAVDIIVEDADGNQL